MSTDLAADSPISEQLELLARKVTVSVKYWGNNTSSANFGESGGEDARLSVRYRGS